MKLKNMLFSKTNYVFILSILLVLENSLFFIKFNTNIYIEILSCLMLEFGVLFSFFKENKTNIKNKISLACIILFMMIIGILLQKMDLMIKCKQVFVAVILVTIILLSKKFLNNSKYIKVFSYGIIFGLFIATFLSLISNINVTEISSEGLLNYGFNGGLQYKNYFATTALASLMGLLINYRYFKRSLIDVILVIILCIFIFLSSSRGAYLLLVIFVLIIYADTILRFVKGILTRIKTNKIYYRILCIIFTVVISLGFIFFFYYLMHSRNYMYRVRGIQNYLNYYRNDYFHLVFGNSEMAFSNPNLSYVENIRQTIQGYNGSYEMGFINILVKNGFIGIIAYMLMYYYLIKNALQNAKSKIYSKKLNYISISILILLLISSFVEAYICSVHTLFGIYCYLLIHGLQNINQKEVQVK